VTAHTLEGTVDEVIAGTARWAIVRGESLGVLQSLPAGSVDLLATDPPYSSGGMTRGDRMSGTEAKYVQTDTIARGITVRPDFAGDNRDQRSFAYWCALWLSECLRVSRPGGAAAVFTDWRQLPSTTDAFQSGGWVWRGILPWDKTESVRPTRGRFASQCEYVVWGSAGPMPVERDAPTMSGIIRERVNHADKHHMTGKPVATMQQVVRLAERGGLVLDPFCGSASTGVACLREGMRFIGVEVTEEYYSVATERMRAEERGLTPSAANAGQESLFGTEVQQ